MTSSHQTFRLLIVALWITTVIGIALDFSLEAALPEPLRDYLSAQMDKPLTLLELTGLAAGIAAVGFMILGSVRLYRLNTNGRRPFLTGVVLSIAIMPLVGPAVYNGWSALFYETSMVLAGVITGWAYLDIKDLDRTSGDDRNAIPNGPPPIK